MKQILLTLFLLTSAFFSWGKTQFEESFTVSLNQHTQSIVKRLEDKIETTTTFISSGKKIQVDYHFDQKVLFYIDAKDPTNDSSRTYSVKRITKNGYGYRYKKTDEKLDFFFPRNEAEENKELLNNFSLNPDFYNQEQLVVFMEALYRALGNYVANELGSLQLFGEAVSKKEFTYLFYRFDNNPFSDKQKIKIDRHFFQHATKDFDNDYKISLNLSELKNHKKIYFSSSLKPLPTEDLSEQSALNLDALRGKIAASPTEKETRIHHDIFIDQELKKLLQPKAAKEDERKFIGNYTTANKPTTEEKMLENGDVVFDLKEGNLYYSKSLADDEEEVGYWRINTEGKYKKIEIYNVYRMNPSIGYKIQPSDIGSSFDILIDGERLMYPVSPPAYKGLSKIE